MDNIDSNIQNSDLIMPKFKETFSDIFLMSYSYSEGGVSVLIPKREGSLAYCIEPPHKIFEKLYPDYFVTNFKGFDFFDEEKLGLDGKAYGLGIKEIEPVLAGGVKLEEVLELPVIEKFKRKKSLSAEEARKILSGVNEQQRMSEFLDEINERLLTKGIRDFYENQRKGPSKKTDFWIG